MAGAFARIGDFCRVHCAYRTRVHGGLGLGCHLGVLFLMPSGAKRLAHDAQVEGKRAYKQDHRYKTLLHILWNRAFRVKKDNPEFSRYYIRGKGIQMIFIIKKVVSELNRNKKRPPLRGRPSGLFIFSTFIAVSRTSFRLSGKDTGLRKGPLNPLSADRVISR